MSTGTEMFASISAEKDSRRSACRTQSVQKHSWTCITPRSEGEAPDGRPILDLSVPETFRWLCERYYGSAEFKLLDAQTRGKRRAILESCCREARKPGSPDLMANCPLIHLGAGHVKMLRDRKLETPEAANGRVKAIRRLLACGQGDTTAAERERRPRRRPHQDRIGGISHLDPPHEVELFEQRWPVGTKPRLALALLMLTGQRKSDVIRLGRPHETRRGELHFTHGQERPPQAGADRGSHPD